MNTKPLQGRPTATRSSPKAGASLPADDVIDVPSEDMDLAELADLAKKIVERKPNQ
jgi:hypothetical protein